MAPSPQGLRLAAVSAPLGHDPGRIRDTARELLSRPPYRETPTGPFETLVARIRSLLAEVLSNLVAAVQASTTVAWIVAVVGAALLGAAVWYWTRGLAADRRIAAAPAEAPGRSVDEWLAEADRHAMAGRWDEALRHHYGALVTALTDASVVDDVPGRTARELAVEVASVAPEWAEPVAAVGARFEAAWYGNLGADADDVAAARTAVETVRAGRRPVGSGV